MQYFSPFITIGLYPLSYCIQEYIMKLTLSYYLVLNSWVVYCCQVLFLVFGSNPAFFEPFLNLSSNFCISDSGSKMKTSIMWGSPTTVESQDPTLGFLTFLTALWFRFSYR